MSQPRERSTTGQQGDANRIDQLRADIAGPVGDVIDHLPTDIDVIERAIAEGSGADDLQRLLASLPDAGDLADLEALLNRPEELAFLLRQREAEAQAALTPDDPPRDAT